MSFNIRNHISPDSPILVMYNHETDQLGLSAEAWDLVVVINFVPFVRYKPDPEDYEEYYGDNLGYAQHEGAVGKDISWTTVGEF